MTEINKRKRDMKELWKATFHDSDRYIDLVFDAYFSKENSFVRYHENRIIAAMLCVAYEFQILAKDGTKRPIKGMYLCGLATHPEWRRRGIMADLMKEAERDIMSRGYDFVFLIPADDHLREYYKKKGFRNSSWRACQTINHRYTNLEDSPEEPHIYSVKDFFRDGRDDFLDKLADWCREIELSRRSNTIVHSCKDFLTIMAENENTIFITDSSFDPKYPIVENVIAVVFPEPPNEPDIPVRIVGLFYKDATQKERQERQATTYRNAVGREQEKCGSRDRTPIDCNKTFGNEDLPEQLFVSEILNSILLSFQQQTMQLLLPCMKKDTKDGKAEPYAMIKPLHRIENRIEDENLEFEISLMLD